MREPGVLLLLVLLVAIARQRVRLSVALRKRLFGRGGARRRGSLSLLLLVRDPSGLGLHFAHLAQIQTDDAGAERIGLGLASILLKCRSQAAYERVQRAPGLAKRAGARVRGVGQAEEVARR